MEQFLCARGYSNEIAGLASSSYLGSLILGSIPIGVVAHKTKKVLLISKIFLAVCALATGVLAYFVTIPDHPTIIISICIIIGASAG